jgi:hypothetical protein
MTTRIDQILRRLAFGNDLYQLGLVAVLLTEVRAKAALALLYPHHW